MYIYIPYTYGAIYNILISYIGQCKTIIWVNYTYFCNVVNIVLSVYDTDQIWIILFDDKSHLSFCFT